MISDALARAIRENFLESVLEMEVGEEEDLESGKAKVRVLAMVSQCWIHVRSIGLANEFSLWLFGDNCDPELDGVITHPLKHALLGKSRSLPNFSKMSQL